MATPSLSTIRQPGFEMGQKAAELLITEIQSKGDSYLFHEIVMPTELIVRESSVR